MRAPILLKSITYVVDVSVKNGHLWIQGLFQVTNCNGLEISLSGFVLFYMFFSILDHPIIDPWSKVGYLARKVDSHEVSFAVTTTATSILMSTPPVPM